MAKLIGVMTVDAKGIVADVLVTISRRPWTVGPIWGEARCGGFFLIIAFDPISSPNDDEMGELINELRSKSYQALAYSFDGDFGEDIAPTDLVANITIEGKRRFDILQNTVNLIKDQEATVTSLITESDNGEDLRYILTARYSAPVGQRLRGALQKYSRRHRVEFTSELKADAPLVE